MIRRALRATVLCALVAPALGVLTLPPASAETAVSGLIDEDTTWTAANSPYLLTDDVTIEAGATLTIEPGVTVKRPPYSASALLVEGTLDAAGTHGALISWVDDGGAYSGWPFIRPVTASAGSVSLIAVRASGQNLVALDRFSGLTAEFAAFELRDSSLTNSEVRVDGSSGPVDITGNAVSQSSIMVDDPTSTTSVTDNRFRSSSFACAGSGRLDLRNNTFERGLQFWQGARVASQGDCVIDADDNFWEASSQQVRNNRLEGADRIQLSSVLEAPSPTTPTLLPAPQSQERLTDEFGRSILRVQAGSDGGEPATIVATAVNRETDEVEETHEIPTPAWNAEGGTSVDITFTDLVPGQLYRLTSSVKNVVGTNAIQETESFLAPEQTDGPPPAPGTITQDTSWTADMSPIVLSQPVTIPAGVTLTIDAGVQVRTEDNYYGELFVLRGALLSAGTRDNPVTITSTSCCGPPLVTVPTDTAQSASLHLSHNRIAGQNVRLLGDSTPGTVSVLDSRMDRTTTTIDGSASEITFERNRVVGTSNESFDIANPAEGDVVVKDNRFRRMDVTCSGAGRLTMSGNTFERTSRAGSRDECVLDLRGNYWEAPDGTIGSRIIGAGRVSALPTAPSPTLDTPTLEPDSISIYRYGQQDAATVEVSAGSDGGATSTITAVAIDRETGDVAETQSLPLAQAQGQQVVLRFTDLQPGRLYRVSAHGENSAGRTATVETDSFVIPEGQQEEEPDGGILVSGTITSDMTWTVDDSPVTVAGTLVIPEGRTVTVEAGVIVRGRSVNGSRALIRVGGTFDARGRTGEPVVIDGTEFGCCGIFASPRNLDGGVVSLDHVTLRAGRDAYRLWARDGADERAAERISITDSVLTGVSIDAFDIEGTTLEISRSSWTGGRLSLADAQPTTTLTHNRFRSMNLSCQGSGRLTAPHNTFERDSVYLSSQDDCILDVSNSHWEVPEAQVPGRISGAARAIVRPIASGPSSDTPRLSPAQPYVSYRLDDAGDVVATVYPGSDGGAAASVTTRLVNRETGEVVSESVEPSAAPGQEVTTTFVGTVAGQLYRVSAVAESSVGVSPESTTESFLAPRPGPAAPTGVSATRDGTSVTLSWEAARLEGVEELTGFIVEDADGNVYRELGPTVRTTVIEGLDAGEYSFTVRATNQFGTSRPSDSATVTIPLPSTGGGGGTEGGGGGGGGGGGTPTTTLPEAPTNVTATRGDGKAVVSWTPPAQQDAITGYLVYVSPGERVISAERSVSSLTVTNLANGEPYTFAVEAVSERGAGERSASSAPVVPAGVPAAAHGLAAAAGDGSLELSWAQADDNGAEVTGYVLTASPGDHEMSIEPGITQATLSGLENGTEYSLSLVAVNEIGVGAAATTIGTPGTTPTAPDGVDVVAKDGKLEVRWEPATARGYAITGYRLDVAPGRLSTTVDATATRAVISGLENGVAYSVSVVALSDVGEGEPAYATDAATPAGEPARVDQPTLVVKKRGIKVSWSAPDARGSSIEGYLVTGTDGIEKSVGAGRSTIVIRGLVRGQSYRFRVQALSDQGPSRQGRWSERLTW